MRRLSMVRLIFGLKLDEFRFDLIIALATLFQRAIQTCGRSRLRSSRASPIDPSGRRAGAGRRPERPLVLGFERFRTLKAAGDAGEDSGGVAGAERAWVTAERVGELLAEVDELADVAEKARDAAGVGFGGVRRVGHELSRNTGQCSASRKLSPVDVG
jgi:hypothetical protein